MVLVITCAFYETNLACPIILHALHEIIRLSTNL